jgi:Family of unknown function (DUF5996)
VDERWPPLPLAEWQDTKDTLQLYLQIVGKIRMVLTPPEPQWAHVTLYVTSRGLTTSPIPYERGTFQIDLDFISHVLTVNRSDGRSQKLDLSARSVASFYEKLMSLLAALGISVNITLLPQEVPATTPFTEDTSHASYDRAHVERFWRILSAVDVLLKRHRAPFRGRHTPVHLFWGGFDLAYTRYTGDAATPPPGANFLYKTSMDAEEIYTGFWPGDARFPEAAFACYVYPKPAGLEQRKLRPAAAFWNASLGNFILRYEDVRNSGSPQEDILKFFASSYDECASCAGWDRAKLG